LKGARINYFAAICLLVFCSAGCAYPASFQPVDSGGRADAWAQSELATTSRSTQAPDEHLDRWAWLRVCEAARAGDVARMQALFERMPESGAYPRLHPMRAPEYCAFNAFVRAGNIDKANTIFLNVLHRGMGRTIEFGHSFCNLDTDDIEARDRWVRSLGDQRLLMVEYLLQISDVYSVDNVSRCLREATESNPYVQIRLMRRQLSAEFALGSPDLANQVATEILDKVNEFSGCGQLDVEDSSGAGRCYQPGELWIEWPIAELVETSGLPVEAFVDCGVQFEVGRSGEVLMSRLDIDGCLGHESTLWVVDTALRTRVYLPMLVDGQLEPQRLSLTWP
jgi:hypothetical protein